MINPISPTVDPLTVMQKSLDALSLQHNVIANNLANIDTPNFKRSVVSFQDKLKVAIYGPPPTLMWRTNPRDLPMPAKNISLNNFEPDVTTINDTIGRNDGNNVDMEVESSLLAENNLLYNSLAQVTSLYIKNLTHAITEGKE